MRISTDAKFMRISREICARIFPSLLVAKLFGGAGEGGGEMGVAQFAPFSIPRTFSRKKRGMVGMNKRETVEDFRQRPHIHN